MSDTEPKTPRGILQPWADELADGFRSDAGGFNTDSPSVHCDRQPHTNFNMLESRNVPMAGLDIPSAGGHHLVNDIPAFVQSNKSQFWSDFTIPASMIPAAIIPAVQWHVAENIDSEVLSGIAEFHSLLSRFIENQEKIRAVSDQISESLLASVTTNHVLVKLAALDALLLSVENQCMQVTEELTIFQAIAIPGKAMKRPGGLAGVALSYWLARKRIEKGMETIVKSFVAHLRHREALKVMEHPFGFEDGLESRIFLAKILSDLNRWEDALDHVLSGFTDFMSTRLQCETTGPMKPFSAILFEETLNEKLASKPFLQMLELLQMLHKKVGHDGSLDQAITVTFLIQTDIEEDCLDLCKILSNIALLSHEYSKALMPLRADIVYEFALTELLLQRCDEKTLGNVRRRGAAELVIA